MEMGRHQGTGKLIACLLASALLLEGCADRPVNGYFVSNGTHGQIVMVHLVEAPRGHLSGAIVVTTINPSASKLDVSDDSVAGSIAGHNVSLKVLGAFSTVARWLGDDNLLVGSLDGGRLTLSKGNQTFVFDQISAGAYQNRVQDLQRVAGHINQTRDVAEALKRAGAYVQKVNTAIQQYLAWGRARIANQEEVKHWYAEHIKAYSDCLDTIKPLANAGVPSWRWQTCVLNVENDAYDRLQALKGIQGLVDENGSHVASLKHMIEAGRAKIEAAGQQLHMVCPDTPHPQRCEAAWGKWKTHEARPFAHGSVAAFRALAPQVGHALQADLDIATPGNVKLYEIEVRVEQIYKSART